MFSELRILVITFFIVCLLSGCGVKNAHRVTHSINIPESQIWYEYKRSKQSIALSKEDRNSITKIISEKGKPIVEMRQYLPGKVFVKTEKEYSDTHGFGSIFILYRTKDGWRIVARENYTYASLNNLKSKDNLVTMLPFMRV